MGFKRAGGVPRRVSTGLILGIVAFAPAFLLVYWVLGAQEEFFDHKAMVIALIGGLVLGIVIAIPEMFILVDAGVLFVIPMFAVVETMGKTVLLGLGRFRDKAQTVLLGGAVGATMSAMLMMFYVQTVVDWALDWQLVVRVGGAAVGFTGAHFVTGMMLGQGPARGNVLGGFMPALLWLLPAHVFLGLLGLTVVNGHAVVQPLAGDWFWAIPLALYGFVLVVWKTPRLVLKGLPQSQRRKIRREQKGRWG